MPTTRYHPATELVGIILWQQRFQVLDLVGDFLLQLHSIILRGSGLAGNVLLYCTVNAVLRKLLVVIPKRGR